MRATELLSSEKILNQAVTQLDRVAAAPAPDKVAVDGRSLAQVLAFGARFGALVRFYDLDDQPNGDWSEFFALDPAIANAVHAALDIPEIERELRRMMTGIHDKAVDETCLPDLLRVIGVVVKLLGILDRTRHHDTDIWAAFGRFTTIDRADSLAAPLRRARQHLATRNPMLGFDGCWRRPDRDWVKEFLAILEDVILGLLEELRHGLRTALAAVETSLQSLGHAPQAALYDAFVVLYTESLREMNRFPRRMLDFYYGRILRQDSRAEKPAHVFLTFTLAKGAEEANIPKAALFLAGTDPAGEAIYYAADTALEVTPTAVTQLHVHRVILDDQSKASPAVTRILSGIVTNAADGTGPSEPFPLFGSDSPGRAGALTLTPATIGFVIASATLTLAGGSRTISLCVFPPQEQAADAEKNQAIAAAIRNSFDLYYTAAGAWVTIETFTVAQGPAPGSFSLTFTLPPDAPAMVPLASLPAADIQTASLPASAFPAPGPLPAILGLFQWRADADSPQAGGQSGAFECLSQLLVDTASITVTVADLPPEALSSSGGAIDPSQNFPLFGLVPTQNSDLRISAPELFLKQPSSLSVSLAWASLPVTRDGFRGYYKGYQIDADGYKSPTPLFDNSTFQASLGVISPGGWTLPYTPQPLFQTTVSTTAIAGSGDTLAPTSVLTAPAITAGTAPPYYDPSSSLLTVTLTEPSYAFGNILYSSNLTAAANANIAALRTGGVSAGSAANATTQISSAAAANASTADKSHADTLKEAVGKATAALNGSVLSALRQAVTASGADPATISDWLHGIESAVIDKVKGGTVQTWLTGGSAPDAETIATRLGAWLEQHEQALSASAAALLQQARSALSAHGTLSSALKSSSGQSVAAARATLSAAFEQAQVALAGSGTAPGTPTVLTPNPPWLPMASSVTLGYQASVSLQVAPSPSADSLPLLPDGEQFYHLDLFDRILPVAASSGSTVAILPQIVPQASLYIELSPPARQVSLLFILQAGPDGWSAESPTLSWEQQIGLSWHPVTVLADGTDNLLNSGIVTLQLHALPSGTVNTRIRVTLLSATGHAPYVKSVTANAVSASWVGPGGAAQLGMPLPAGTITTSKDSIAGLGAIDQPEDSLGGIAPATGKSFDLWMAERMRHKGFAIDGWDYARHALAEIPILWQAAVVPATDAATAAPAPGHVWVVAVGGPLTPNVSDPTEPMVSPEVLDEIRDALASISSPFITLGVTNPPYRRVTVVANLVFDDEDPVAANIEKLDAELVKWLSPWPAPELGPRPDDYYTRHAIADFVRRRRYVRGVASLRLRLEAKKPDAGWYYLTSAKKHEVRGRQDGTEGGAAVPA